MTKQITAINARRALNQITTAIKNAATQSLAHTWTSEVSNSNGSYYVVPQLSIETILFVLKDSKYLDEDFAFSKAEIKTTSANEKSSNTNLVRPGLVYKFATCLQNARSCSYSFHEQGSPVLRYSIPAEYVDQIAQELIISGVLPSDWTLAKGEILKFKSTENTSEDQEASVDIFSVLNNEKINVLNVIAENFKKIKLKSIQFTTHEPGNTTGFNSNKTKWNYTDTEEASAIKGIITALNSVGLIEKDYQFQVDKELDVVIPSEKEEWILCGAGSLFYGPTYNSPFTSNVNHALSFSSNKDAEIFLNIAREANLFNTQWVKVVLKSILSNQNHYNQSLNFGTQLSNFFPRSTNLPPVPGNFADYQSKNFYQPVSYSKLSHVDFSLEFYKRLKGLMLGESVEEKVAKLVTWAREA